MAQVRVTRTWMNTSMLDSAPWEHRLCIAVELSPNSLLYITDGGHTHITDFGDEGIHMPRSWVLLPAERE